MTPQEQQLLQGLADRVNQTVLPEKDDDAERFLQQSLSRNPDAIYILAQTVLVQQYALDQAKQQLDQARQQAQQTPPQPKKSTSFLGNLLGMNDTPPPPPPAQGYAPVQNYTPQPQYGQPQYAQQYSQPQYAQPQQFGAPQQGGFLRSAMTTAAGVAAGALAFEGIESLMHGFGHHAGYGQDFGSFGSGGGREEIVNNYYGDSADRSDRSDRGDLADRFAASGDQPSSDVEDRRDDNQFGFADTSASDDSDSGLADDDSSDSDSFDDGGSDFSSSDDSNS